jgi:nitrate/TMAO reductase-like tetraheme cytochrome c subunit
MALTLKNFINWCKRHILLVTLLAIGFIVVFGFVNIQILHMTSEPEFCAMCHPKHGVGPLAEVDSWEHSGHSEAGVSCLDCHGRPGPVGYMKAKLGGLYDTYMQFTISKEEKLEILSNPGADLVPMEHCLFCHSDEGNREYRENHKGPLEIVEMRLLDSVENPEFRERKGLPDIMAETFVGGTHFDHSFHIESFDLTCRDCHFGVVHQPGTKTERMNTCVTCHEENEGSSAPLIGDCTACHEAQLAMNEGKGAMGVEGDPGVMHAADINCQMCHSAVEKGLYRPGSSTCTDCHDEGYVEVFNDWAKTIDAKVDRLGLLRADAEKALKKADELHRDTRNGWVLYEKGLYNLNFVKDDGTHGVHNNDYAQAILKSVESDFKQILKDLNIKW